MKKVSYAFMTSLFLSLSSCGEAEKKESPATNENEQTTSYSYDYERVVPDLQIAWSFAFLPDESILITEKSGELIHFKNGEKQQVQGAPEVYQQGQGGFLDVFLHPEYESNGWIYFTYASDEGEGEGGNTALMRAKLEDGQLVQKEHLYKGTPNSTAGQHFGSRIAFDEEGYLYFTIGDRGNLEENPQDLSRDGGKTYRLNADGSIPSDNPFTEQENAKPAIYSYGHRNPQGMAINPETGDLWLHEHGPQGGDEVNIVKEGANYGWPEVTYGIDYDDSVISEETTGPDYEDPIHYWDPSIAPSGMAFVTSDKYPELKGDLLVGSLKFLYVEHLELEGEEVVGRNKIAEGIGRVRDIRQGPDGFIYISLEGKGIVKLIGTEEEAPEDAEQASLKRTPPSAG